MAKPKEEPIGMTQAQFANFRDVTASRISQLRKLGKLILLEDGSIDALASAAALDAPAAHGKNAKYYLALTKKIEVQIKHAELDLAARRGELVSGAKMFEAATTCFTNCRVRLRGLARSLAPLLVSHSEPREIEDILLAGIDRALESLSEDPFKP